MNYPIVISFRLIDRSASLERLVRDQAGRLGRHCVALAACCVTLEPAGRPRASSSLFHVRVDAKIADSSEAVQAHALDRDPYLATFSAFRVATNSLRLRAAS
ncbi:hypothetical protein EPN52_05380 [bacterium]|nr:MAG: hypothetical protein EPN52_05380 [bacterium]